MAKQSPRMALPSERWRSSIEAEIEARIRSEIQAEIDEAVAKVEAERREQLEISAQAEILGLGKSAEIEERLDRARAEFEQREDVYREALNEARHKIQTEASLRAEVEQRVRLQSEALAQAEARAQAESTLRAEAELRAQMEAQTRAIAEARAEVEAELRSEAERRAASQASAIIKDNTKYGEPAESASKTAPCEGCGRQNIPEYELAKVESGQLVCPDCLMLVRA